MLYLALTFILIHTKKKYIDCTPDRKKKREFGYLNFNSSSFIFGSSNYSQNVSCLSNYPYQIYHNNLIDDINHEISFLFNANTCA